MTELVNKLVTEAGLTPDQAMKTIGVVKQFVVEKFPMLSGAVDNVFKEGDGQQHNTTGQSATNESGSILDKISDYIPGEVGQKIEGFAKKAAGAATEGLNKARNIVDDLEKRV